MELNEQIAYPSHAKRGPEPGPDPNDRLLNSYLREVGATKVLDRETEVYYFAKLERCRSAFAELVSSLPRSFRKEILPADGRGPERGAKWPLRELEASFARMVIRAESSENPNVIGRVDEARRLKGHIDRTRETLIRANLRFVAHVVKKMNTYGLPFIDLVQEGNIGLMDAVERFEHGRGNRFSTYATWWIQRSIWLAMRSSFIRLPEHVTDKLSQLRQASADLTRALNRLPTPDELAQDLGWPIKRVHQVLGVVREPRSLDGVDTEGEHPAAIRFHPDPDSPNPLSETLDLEVKEKVVSALRILKPQEEVVIRLRFGIGRRGTRHTLREVGRMLNLSRERVRQIESRALARLQASREAQGLFSGRTRR